MNIYITHTIKKNTNLVSIMTSINVVIGHGIYKRKIIDIENYIELT